MLGLPMTYKNVHQPYTTIQDKPKPNYHGIALNNAGVISDFSKVLEDRNKEIEELKEFKKNWIKLREILQLTIDYQNEQDMHLLVDYIQILDEMKKLEEGEKDEYKFK